MLFPGVVVEPGAEIEDSIVFQDGVLESGHARHLEKGGLRRDMRVETAGRRRHQVDRYAVLFDLLLADGEVSFHGQMVAVVIAESIEIARRAGRVA